MLIPPLVQAYDAGAGVEPAEGEARRSQIAVLRELGLPLGGRLGADSRWPSSGARSCGGASAPRRAKAGVSVYEYMRTKRATPQQRLEALAAAIDKLAADFGKWKTPWGDINRFQRIDRRHRAAVRRLRSRASRWRSPSARWGSLASFGARAYHGTKKWYGTSGNSFVAVVEFGDQVQAQGGDRRRPEQRSRRRSTSTTRRSATRPATCARSTSTASSSKGHTEREYKPGQ